MRRRCCCVASKCHANWSYVHSSDTCETCFTDESTASSGCTVDSWLWEFSDGETSTSQNPCHTFDPESITFPKTAKLTITTSCGFTCTSQKEINIPCQDSPPICYPSTHEGLPQYFLVSMGNMPVKGVATRLFTFKHKNDVVDADNRLLCGFSFGNQSIFSERDFTPLNGNYEVPFLSGPSLTGTYTYWTGIIDALANRWYLDLEPNFPDQTILPDLVKVSCYLVVTTDFTCDSLGATGYITAQWRSAESGTPTNNDQLIGTWTKELTLPVGVTLKEMGPIILDPVSQNYKVSGYPQAWTYPYSDPCGEPPTGTPPIDFPTCVVNPNG